MAAYHTRSTSALLVIDMQVPFFLSTNLLTCMHVHMHALFMYVFVLDSIINPCILASLTVFYLCFRMILCRLVAQCILMLA